MDIPFNLEELDNGLQLLTVLQPDSDIVYLEFQVPAGRYYEHEYEAAHFLEHLIAHWTSKLYPNAHEINTRIGDLGAQSNASVSGNLARYYISGRSKDLAELAGVLINAYLDFSMDEGIFEQERNAVTEELRSQSVGSWLPLKEAVAEHLFPEHPASVKLEQRITSTAHIQSETLLDEYQRLYTPDRTLFVVVGDTSPQQIADIVKPLLHMTPFHKRSKITVPTFVAPKQTATELLYVPTLHETTKVKFLYRLPFTKFDEQQFAVKLLCRLLVGGLSSRLLQKLRGELGLVYSVKCNADLDPVNHDLGTLKISMKTRPANVPTAIGVVLGELEQLAQRGPEKREIERLQNQLDVDESNIRLVDIPQKFAAQYSRGVLFGHSPKTFEWSFQQIRKQATHESIQALAQRIFKPDNLVIAYSSQQNMNTELGEVISRLIDNVNCRICSRPSQYVCNACSCIHYCSKECQKTDWLAHRSVCVKARHDDNDYEITAE
jgi:predicted Zn-dependent peptidase